MAKDPLFERVMEFSKHKKPSSGLSNLYVAQTIDRDGNVTSETYGMNAFTNYGFSRFFNSNIEWPRNLYIGQGADETVYGMYGMKEDGTTPLFEYITSANDTSRNTTIDYKYPLYYDKTTGIITCICKFQVSTFDYNINGVSGPVSVTEYGIGESWDKLWTHSWVYDIQGARTTITKYLNEQLIITVYFCMSYHQSLITSGWSEGRYTVITTPQRFLQTRNNNFNMTEQSVGMYKRYDTVNAFNRTFTRSLYANNQMTLYTNINGGETDGGFTMIDQHGTAHGYLDGFYNYTPGFVIVEPQVLTAGQAEAFDIVIQNRYDNFSSTSMVTYIGEDTTADGHKAPFTQMDLKHVYLYDKYAASYSNPLPFTSSPNRWYCETPMQTQLRTVIYYTNMNDYVEAYVYQNVHPEDNILGFTNTDIGMLYGTNAYWDRSTWVEISTRGSIPENVQNMRYYITNTGSISLNPIRKSGDLTIIPSTGIDKTLTTNFGDVYTNPVHDTCNNYERGYIVIGNSVWQPESGTRFIIGSNLGSNLTASKGYLRHFCYGNRILTLVDGSNNGGYYVTNTDDLNSIYTVSVSMVGEDGFDAAFNITSNTYRTETHTGAICFQALDRNRCVIVDLTKTKNNAESVPYQIALDSYMAGAIYRTIDNRKYVAYIPTDETPTLKILDVDDESEFRSLELPSGVATTATLIFGLNQYVWVTNCSTYCYRYNIQTQVRVSCNMSGFSLVQSKTDARNVHITAVDDVLLIYRRDQLSLSKGFYVRTDESIDTPPIYNLTDFAADISYWRDPMFYHLEYVENHTLLLIAECGYGQYDYNGSVRHVIDFGQWLNPPSDAHGRVKKDLYLVDRPMQAFYPYGKNVIWNNKLIPMAYLLPMRWVGTTRTHTAVNNLKHVSGKQWSMTVSNIPPSDYGENGYPPGAQI